jgi:PAS domain S-box-containing protein
MAELDQAAAAHKVQPLTLQSVKEQIDAAILRNVTLSMRIAAAGGVMMYIALAMLPSQDPAVRHARMVGGILLAASGLASLYISKRWNARTAAAFFATLAFLVSYGVALKTGMGIAAPGGPVPIAMIVIMGCALGPRAGRLATWLSIAGIALLLGTELLGFVSGMRPNNTPPVATHAIVLTIVCLVVGSTITHFSRLFWSAMQTIENARQELQAKVDMHEKTQHELLESKQRMAALLDHAPMSVLIFDKDSGRLHYANRHAIQAHGADKTGDLTRHCLYTDAPHTEQHMLQLVHRTRDEGSQELNWRSRKADGEAIWWAIKMDMLEIDGTPYVVSFGHDITKRLQAEQALIDHHAHLEEEVRARTSELTVQRHRLEAVIEALPVSLSIKDREGRYQLSNRLFEEATGLSKALLMGNTADELFPLAMAEQIREHDHLLFAGTPMVRYENSRMRRDGSRKDHLVTKVPLMDAEGVPEAILTLAVDISDQKTMQRELASAKNEAERLATVKSEFLANMSHEIRTPLHGVLGLAQLEQKLPPGDPQVQQVLDRINRSGRHLLGVINDILDFSKIDAGKLTIETCALDPRQLAEDAVAMLEERASGKGLSLQLQCMPTPPAVMGDPLRIRQVLINLLSNGVKFTAQGRITLTLSAGHGQLYFEVRDTGIGMSPEALDRIFSPFEQADGSTSRRFGGTGLGLSISRKLALLMGGDIRLHSALGEGSTFTLVLPLQMADSASLPKPERLATMAALERSNSPRLNGLRILAADDVDINRDIMHGLLTQQQAEVHCADNGQHAIDIHKAHEPGHFDIVLMDVQMPVMDGLQATELLLSREPDLPVVALTAHAMSEERQRCVAAGMVGHLAKPFDADDMIRLILQHTRRAPQPPRPGDATTAPSPGQATPHSADTTLFDAAGALKRCGGKEALLHKLVTRFTSDQADFTVRCQQLLAEDMEQARRAAHMLRGTAANLGLGALSEQASELENALIANDTARIGRSLQALSVTMKQHIAVLQTWLAEQVPA